MPNLSCPSVDLNFLSPNGFQLQIERLPTVSFFTSEISLPSVSLEPLTQPTPLSDASIPGDKLEFDSLTLTFMVDEKMNNWEEVFKWMRGLGFPENYKQYSTENIGRGFISSDASELARNYSDAKLFILGSNNVTVRTITFVDCFPTSLGGIQFSSQNTDVPYATASLTLRYSYFTFT